MTLQSEGHASTDRDVRRLAPWFHNLHLPGGLCTAPDHPLGDFPAFKWRALSDHIAADLSGRRVLDVGCNAGFYSFALAQRGASVVGIDHDEHYLEQAEWARGRMGLEGRVEFRKMGVYDVGDLREQFDLVLFLGVLYHLRYPLLGLDLVAERVKSCLILQTLTMPGGSTDGAAPDDLAFTDRRRWRGPDWPVMAFIEHGFAGDRSNWWAPSRGAVEAMVRTTGLRVASRPSDDTWICTRGESGDP